MQLNIKLIQQALQVEVEKEKNVFKIPQTLAYHRSRNCKNNLMEISINVLQLPNTNFLPIKLSFRVTLVPFAGTLNTCISPSWVPEKYA